MKQSYIGHSCWRNAAVVQCALKDMQYRHKNFEMLLELRAADVFSHTDIKESESGSSCFFIAFPWPIHANVSR